MSSTSRPDPKALAACGRQSQTVGWRPAIGLGIIGLALAAAGLKGANKPGVSGRGVTVGGLVTALLGTILGGVVLGGVAAIVNNKSQLDRIQTYIDDARAKLLSSSEVRNSVPGQ